MGPRNNNENGQRRRIDGVLPQLVHALPLWRMAASHIARSYPLLGWHPLSSFHRYRHTVELSVALIAGWPFVHERESEIERVRERERGVLGKGERVTRERVLGEERRASPESGKKNHRENGGERGLRCRGDERKREAPDWANVAQLFYF